MKLKKDDFDRNSFHWGLSSLLCALDIPLSGTSRPEPAVRLAMSTWTEFLNSYPQTKFAKEDTPSSFKLDGKLSPIKKRNSKVLKIKLRIC